MQLLRHSLSRLRDDGEFILCRAHPKQTELSSVLLLAPASTRPSPETLKKIGQITPMLEAAGGETLDGFLSGAVEMTQLLGFAIRLATHLAGCMKRI